MTPNAVSASAPQNHLDGLDGRLSDIEDAMANAAFRAENVGNRLLGEMKQDAEMVDSAADGVISQLHNRIDRVFGHHQRLAAALQRLEAL